MKRLFLFMVVVGIMSLLEYFIYQLHNTSVVIVAMRLINQTELSATSTVLKKLLNNFLVAEQRERMRGTPFTPVEETGNWSLLACEEPSPLLVGPFRVDFPGNLTLQLLEQQNPSVREGGWWRPRGCLSEQRVAIIIPFREREEHLKILLFHLHPFLQRQRHHYKVYIINQAGQGQFNRAKLMNIGYMEAVKENYNCFIFSDVDLIPMDDRNSYSCSDQPRHLSVAVDKFGFRLPYPGIFGGVTALNNEQFQKINGYPNNYWGWGGEDDDVSNRISIRGMWISRPDGLIGRYRMIQHNRDKNNEPNPQRFDLLTKTGTNMYTDGLNSLSYSVLKMEKHRLYTNITVDVQPPS